MVTLLPNRQVLDRPRSAVASHVVVPNTGGNWRLGSAAPAFGGTTGLFSGACAAYMGETTGTQVAKHTIKRPARHLGTRST
ncbi:MAG: hypothetical protein R8G01_17770 [Ilumatobacteraceae bacterium]|nr:hypothetical protein [Ilumatobacteraceae bacterium]